MIENFKFGILVGTAKEGSFKRVRNDILGIHLDTVWFPNFGNLIVKIATEAFTNLGQIVQF